MTMFKSDPTISGDMPGAKKKVQPSTFLRTAMTLFTEKGFSQVTMAQVAKASGVTVAELRSHYETKEELLIAAFRTGHRRMEERLRTIISGDLDAHIGQMFDACLDGLMPFGPEIHLNLLLQATKDRTLMEIVRRTSRNVNFAIKAYLAQMVSLSIIDEVKEVEKVNEELVTSLVENVAGVMEGKDLAEIKKAWISHGKKMLSPSSKTTVSPLK
ncbi:MAG: HTH-type transcriptional regulator BetI [Methanomassiliicoccales archaeon PtaU1.Bin030]|nr:MAG: HTH-type transcriptional regulator BetI [Methanomassiliicoccales archaeon PtaU1.Bin030]